MSKASGGTSPCICSVNKMWTFAVREQGEGHGLSADGEVFLFMKSLSSATSELSLPFLVQGFLFKMVESV